MTFNDVDDVHQQVIIEIFIEMKEEVHVGILGMERSHWIDRYAVLSLQQLHHP